MFVARDTVENRRVALRIVHPRNFIQTGDPYREAPEAVDFARMEIGGVVAYRPPTPDTVLVNPRIGRALALRDAIDLVLPP